MGASSTHASQAIHWESTKNIPSLFSRDGNPSFSGYLFKTVVFGSVFYGLTKLTKQISEI